MLRVWMQESVPPKPFYKHRPGRWVAETQWPSPRITLQRHWLDVDRLSNTAPTIKSQLDFRSPQTTGVDAGEWCGFGAPGETPLDQRGDDGCSLTFDSAPLRERMEILGAPLATLEVAADQPVAVIAVRLNDVAPGGASTRVTYGLLNLTHRDSHEHPQPLEAGKRYLINITLNDVAYAFPPRHKLRLAISTSYWPIAWPAPLAATLSFFTGESFLDLPVRSSDAGDLPLRPFEPPERAAAETTELRPAPLKRIVERDRTTNETIYTVVQRWWRLGWRRTNTHQGHRPGSRPYDAQAFSHRRRGSGNGSGRGHSEDQVSPRRVEDQRRDTHSLLLEL